MRVLAAAVVLAIAASGCTSLSEVPEGVTVVCASTSECPSGRVCNRGRCVNPNAIDTTPPAVSAGTLTASPSLAAAGQTVAIDFQVTEPLGPLPVVTLGLNPAPPVSCGTTAALAYRCTYLVTGNENAGKGGTVWFDVRLEDQAGNAATQYQAKSFVLDFAPPVLAARSVQPAAVPLGGVIQVFFSTDEDLHGTPTITSSRPLGGSVTHVPVQQPGTRNWTFTHLVSDPGATGEFGFSVVLEDPVWNTSDPLLIGSTVVDATPPEVTAVAVTPARIRDVGMLQATFVTDEDPSWNGTLAATVGGRPLACAWAVPVTTCARPMTGGEIAVGTEAAQSVVITMSDAAGNRTTASGSTVFDFRSPGVAFANAAYAPATGGLLSTVQRASAGARVTMTVLADEELAAAPEPTLTAEFAGSVIPFSYLAASSTPTSASFEAVVPPGSADGEYVATVRWVDVAGNVALTGAGLPRVKVKTSAPTLEVKQEALVFVRSPWGNAADENLGGYTIPAGPYFAVEPSDALTTSPTLPEGSLLLGGGVLPSRVLVRSSATGNAQVLGVLDPDGGWFPRGALVNVDVPSVWLTGVDDAGNPSRPVKLLHSEWVATPKAPPFGAVLRAAGSVGLTRDLAPEVAATPPGGAAAGADLDGVVATGAGVWRQEARSAAAPDGRVGGAMAYDGTRGRVVLFGGATSGADAQDTWEWDGTSWAQVAGSGPSARYDHAMAYDSARARVVLFGGAGATGSLGDTWEWDGTTWLLVATSGPTSRSEHRMVYDAARARVVLFAGQDAGGLAGDTWEWDGTAWSQVASSGPVPRTSHALAYDAARAQVVLFGGWSGAVNLQDTWGWDGTGWTLLADTGPSPRGDPAMAYDGARSRVVLFGGLTRTGGVGDTWEWDGGAWTQVSTTGPAARYRHAMAYDGEHGRTVLFGGSAAGFPSDTWLWNGVTWTRAGSPAPGARYGHAIASDRARSRVILFGGWTEAGNVADTWAWNGTGWLQLASTGPSARTFHAMAYDSARDRMVLFGGRVGGSAFGDTWEWDGTTWTEAIVAGPPARYDHAMAYDAARRRVVLFGGRGVGVFPDTWEWDGASWTQVATTGPTARYAPAMVFDAARRRVLLFGGYNAGYRQDTWEWDGASWTQVAATGPSGRYDHAMAFDTARGRAVLFGGWDSAGYLRDTWEWDGSAWAQVAKAGPGIRFDPGLAYDADRARVVLFGGWGDQFLGDTWEWDAASSHRPALQFEVSFGGVGVDPARVTQLAVRALAGGRANAGGVPVPGAMLLGWWTRGAANEPGAWSSPLDANACWLPPGVASLSDPAASRLSWRSSSAAEARRFLVEREGYTFQVRPNDGAGNAPDGSAVALDYIEVRVGYTAP